MPVPHADIFEEILANQKAKPKPKLDLSCCILTLNTNNKYKTILCPRESPMLLKICVCAKIKVNTMEIAKNNYGTLPPPQTHNLATLTLLP